ncbi:MAG: UDP-N-acetylmuramoyl-L-alanine--D-glutamate ligase [Chlorobi bacterium]|nr:UDP-N-acetylmuramoyl-L-alanine--D-glutamate ligase [Chlorobiota bacterium]
MKKTGKIVVLGGGESGTGAAVLAKKKGFEVFLSDKGKIKDKYKRVLKKFEIDFEELKHSLRIINSADEIILSPGIPRYVPFIKDLIDKGVPVISEIEFAARFSSAKLICISGSNGKTTTTLLVYHILKAAGLDVAVAGNVGDSFAMRLAEKDHDFFVLEISSFQLDSMFAFKADFAILLNITPDHLDRYGNKFENYALSKFRITRNQTKNDVFIYNADDETIGKLLETQKVNATIIPFSLEDKAFDRGAFLKGNKIIINNYKNNFTMTLEQLALQGRHNTYNSMAAGVQAKLLEIRNETVKQSLSDFQNVSHRLEYVSSVHGITFINDSKATNVNSTWYALEHYNKPIVWIAGGVDKGNEYESIKELVKQKVKAIICLGLDNSKLHEEFGGCVDLIIDTESAMDAVVTAYQLAKKGEIVLLSPACASFDLFESFEDRGNQFKAAVNAL